jgi:hypothetical protein
MLLQRGTVHQTLQRITSAQTCSLTGLHSPLTAAAAAAGVFPAVLLCCAGEGKWTGFMDGFDGKV